MRLALGTGGIIVIIKQTDILSSIARLSEFYHHESRGQCTPCRGTGWIINDEKVSSKNKCSVEEVELLEQVTKQIEGHTICALGDAAAWLSGSFKNFSLRYLTVLLVKRYQLSFMVKLTINNKTLDVENGITVLQACEMAGVEIPRFCYHERLSIAGNCECA